jgi:thioredoxin-related protein
MMIIIFFFLFLIFRQFGEVYLNSSQEIANDGLPVEQTSPPFHGVCYQTNQMISSNDFAEKPILLVFVSSKCKACKELIPDWNSECEKYKSQIHFVLVGLGDREAYAGWNNKGKLILDSNHEILSAFRVRVTPFAYMIDEHGLIKAKGLCNGNIHLKQLLSSIHSQTENKIRI